MLITLAASTLAFFAIGVWCGTLVLVHPAQFIFGLPAVECACVALLALALQPGRWSAFLCTAPLRNLGRLSYGVYVFHILLEPLFDAIGHRAVHAGTGSAYQLVRFVAGFPITLAAASLSYVLLERPFLRLKRRFPPTTAPNRVERNETKRNRTKAS